MTRLKYLGDFTVLDWIGLINALTQTAGLLFFPFVALVYRDIIRGMVESPTVLTILVTSPSFSLLLGLISCGLLFLLFKGLPGLSLKKQRYYLLASFIFSGLALGICVSATFRPIIDSQALFSPESPVPLHSTPSVEENFR